MDREYFFKNYDKLMPHYCEPYEKFLKIGALAIPDDTKSILDLGIGTGNFSLEIKKRIPSIKIHGIDLDERALKTAKIKIPDAKLCNGNILNSPFPKTDYIISSLATHHFSSETRNKYLLKIAKSSKGFINFDMAIFPNQTFGNVIQQCLKFSSKYFSKQQLKEIEKEMRKNDNPMPLKETIRLFNSNGLEFKILVKQSPYAIYKVFNKFK